MPVSSVLSVAKSLPRRRSSHRRPEQSGRGCCSPPLPHLPPWTMVASMTPLTPWWTSRGSRVLQPGPRRVRRGRPGREPRGRAAADPALSGAAARMQNDGRSRCFSKKRRVERHQSNEKTAATPSGDRSRGPGHSAICSAPPPRRSGSPQGCVCQVRRRAPDCRPVAFEFQTNFSGNHGRTGSVRRRQQRRRPLPLLSRGLAHRGSYVPGHPNDHAGSGRPTTVLRNRGGRPPR